MKSVSQASWKCIARNSSVEYSPWRHNQFGLTAAVVPIQHAVTSVGGIVLAVNHEVLGAGVRVGTRRVDAKPLVGVWLRQQDL